MAVKDMNFDENEDMSFTRRWFELINRGSLYQVNDLTFQLFIEMESDIRILLPKHIIVRSDEDTLEHSV